jgi:DNA polymerase III alpha subunit
MMARFELEDLAGAVPVAVFADQLHRYGHLLEEEAIVLVKGMARDRGADVEITMEEITALEQADSRMVEELDLHLRSDLPTGKMLELRDVLIEHAGDVPVRLSVALEGREIAITPQQRFRVHLDACLVESIERILGPGSVEKRYTPAPPVIA